MNKGQPRTLYLCAETIEHIQQCAQKNQWSFSQAARFLIDAGATFVDDDWEWTGRQARADSGKQSDD